MAAGMLLGRRASFLLPLSLVGCRKTASPTGAAEAFLDAYYVERDHDRALALTTGSAEGRVRKERELLAGTGGDYGVQPTVHYARRKAEAKPDLSADSQELTYEVSIDSSGVQLKKEVRVLVKKVGEDWKVAVFGERDEAVP